MNRERAQQLINIALAHAKADETLVNLSWRETRATRYANNDITQNQERTQHNLSIKVSYGEREGRTTIEDMSEASIQSAMRRAEQIAMLSRPNPEHAPLVEPQTYPEVKAFFQSTADFTAEQRVAEIRKAIALCKERGQKAAGVFTIDVVHSAVGNSRGLFAYHQSSVAVFTITAMTDDSSGWAEECDEDVSRLDILRAAEIASHKAAVCMNPQHLTPQKFSTLLEPAAVADILVFLMWFYDARAADEKRSYMTNRQGTQIALPSVSMYSNPLDTKLPAQPFQHDGMPAPNAFWIKNGIAENLICSHYWALKTNRTVIGYPTNLIMQGGDVDYPDLVKHIDNGLHITRLWYIRVVDPMSLLLTGMTRDSTCYVENGARRYGIINLRFNDSPIRLLQNVLHMSKPKRIGHRYIPVMMPALLVDGFNFTSETRF